MVKRNIDCIHDNILCTVISSKEDFGGHNNITSYNLIKKHHPIMSNMKVFCEIIIDLV